MLVYTNIVQTFSIYEHCTDILVYTNIVQTF